MRTVKECEAFYRSCIEALLIGLEVENIGLFMADDLCPQNCLSLGQRYMRGIRDLKALKCKS